MLVEVLAGVWGQGCDGMCAHGMCVCVCVCVCVFVSCLCQVLVWPGGITSISNESNVFPVGLCGEFSTMNFVRGVTAAAWVVASVY